VKTTAANPIVVDDARYARARAATAGAMDMCYQCGTCSATCPMGSINGGGMVSARQLMRQAQLGIAGNGALWRCVACRACEERCPRGVNIVEAIMGLRALSFEEGTAPPEAHRLLWSTLEEGNPSGDPRAERAKWSEGLGLRDATAGTKTLLYVGCAASYDPRLQRVVRSLTNLLTASGVEFGVLGGKERCCGDSVRSNGERDYLDRLVGENVKTFAATGAETIVAVSPHCYDIFRNLYPKHGLTAEVIHSTQLLERLYDAGKLPTPARREGTVAFHDPCFLGRHNGVYEAPRRLLESVPGLELVELHDNKSNALCCGGGGGGMWRSEEGERLSDRRYNQAKAAQLTTLATSCPYCIQNFDDGARRFGGPKVADVTELLLPQGVSP